MVKQPTKTMAVCTVFSTLLTFISNMHYRSKGILSCAVRHALQAEFSLGKFDRSAVKGTGEELFRPGTDGEEGAIVLEVTRKTMTLCCVLLRDERQMTKFCRTFVDDCRMTNGCCRRHARGWMILRTLRYYVSLSLSTVQK